MHVCGWELGYAVAKPFWDDSRAPLAPRVTVSLKEGRKRNGGEMWIRPKGQSVND